jgi:hypothetical protein
VSHRGGKKRRVLHGRLCLTARILPKHRRKGCILRLHHHLHELLMDQLPSTALCYTPNAILCVNVSCCHHDVTSCVVVAQLDDTAGRPEYCACSATCTSSALVNRPAAGQQPCVTYPCSLLLRLLHSAFCHCRMHGIAVQLTAPLAYCCQTNTAPTLP